MHGPTLTNSGDQRWTITFVTKFIKYDSNHSFAEYFSDARDGTSRFSFKVFFLKGPHLVLNVIVDGKLLTDVSPSINSTCVPQINAEKRRWPWAVPTGMTLTILATFATTLFPPSVVV